MNSESSKYINTNHFFFLKIDIILLNLLTFFAHVSICRTEKEDYIAELTRDNVQLLVNSLWEIPTERVEECIVAKLPVPSFVLPRSKKCPQPKPMTKWEKFAQEKGIRKTKKDKKVFDTELDVCSLIGLLFI